MSDHDEFGAFLVGFIVGGVSGALAALLLAPQSGEETRAVIKDRSIELKDTVVTEAEKAKVKVQEGTVTARTKVDELSKTAVARGGELAQKAKQTGGELVETVKKVRKPRTDTSSAEVELPAEEPAE